MSEESSKVEPVVAAASMDEPKIITKIEGRDWKSWIVLILGAGAPLVAFLAAIGSGWGLWNFRGAFSALMGTLIVAILALVLAALFGWLNKRKSQRGRRLLHWSGVVLAILYLGWIGSYIIKGRSVPAIHNISTDLVDPPLFKALGEREDTWDQIPTNCDGAASSMTPQQRWRICHQNAYGDIRSVRVDMPVAKALKKAESLADARGWDIAAVRPGEGRLEATDTTALFRFKDDVVIRIRPTEDNRASIVDMRSSSRVGISDLGTNAERVRSFLADLTRS